MALPAPLIFPGLRMKNNLYSFLGREDRKIPPCGGIFR